MNTYDRNAPGISGSSFDRWVQKSDVGDESTITKMQHHFWVTKQTLSRKLGKKEDECIVASDAELDAKLELFRSIQESCAFLQRVIDKYQERLCKLAQEENAMGRFLKESGKEDKTRAGKMMTAVGKSLSYSGQQRLTLRGPLVRLYQEVETFRQRAIEDTLQKVQAMEKARTEYRAALSWMKNVSQELDPDTSKQLERFRKVQAHVRRGKQSFDSLTLDCLQKIDLLAAARCNMFSHALVMYQNTLLNFTKKSSQAYSTIANSFKGYQRYDFTVVRELAETSSKLAHETGGDGDVDDKEELLFLEEYHDSVEEAQEVKSPEDDKEKDKTKLLDVGSNEIQNFNFESFESLSDNRMTKSSTAENKNELKKDDVFDFFKSFDSQKVDSVKGTKKPTTEMQLIDEKVDRLNLLETSELGLPLNMSAQEGQSQSFEQLSSENITLLNDILNGGGSNTTEWDSLIGDTFLPPSILKQSLGDALNLDKKSAGVAMSEAMKKTKNDKQKGNSSWLDLFAELDPLNNPMLENFNKDSNAA